MKFQKTYLDWEIGYHSSLDQQPDKWLESSVPGAVQLDVMKGENYKQPYWFDDNFLQFDWMEDWYFTYRARFEKIQLGLLEKLFFESKGIDYEFLIYFNDKLLLHQEGMFTAVNIDLTHLQKKTNELKVILFPIPKIEEAKDFIKGSETYRQNARESVKPAVSYGWDWHPRLVTRGIWDETYLEVRDESFFKSVDLDYELSGDLSVLALEMNIEGEKLKGNKYLWELKDREGKLVSQVTGVFNKNKLKINSVVESPNLWWPVGYGEAYLYTCIVMVFNDEGILDCRESKKGFKQVRLCMNEGAWDEKQVFPITRSVAPASLEINNRKIFAKGTNWVHPEIFIGKITREIYERHIFLAKEANMNILRVWGGGIVNKDDFFEICDREGILVWQEFPLACNNYTDKKKYLKVLEQEAISIVKRVKQYACLTIWSGGNELYNSWSKMTDQSLALRLLNSICLKLSPNIPFIPTSPLYGMAHGHYVFYDPQTELEVFEWMPQSKNTAYPEFGIAGVSNLKVLKKIMPQESLFPPKKGSAWETHHALAAWGEERWLDLPVLKMYFGEISTLEQLVQYSQLLQGEGLKYIYEEARRQKPYCSMALNWCFQEPWPTAANNSLINWPDIPKPAYFEVKKACRPVLASLQASKFKWNEKELFNAQLFILNDSNTSILASTVKISLSADYCEKKLISEWTFSSSDSFENIMGPKLEFKIPKLNTKFFKIILEVEDHSEYNSEYSFLYADENY